MNFLGKMFGASRSQALAGLDLGSATLKVAQVRATPQGVELVTIGGIPTPLEAMKGGVIVDVNLLGEAVAELLAAARLSPGTRLVSAVTGGQVVIRPIQMAKIPDKELPTAIRFEAERYLAYPVSQAQVTGIKLRDIDDKKQETLLIAAPNELVSKAKEVIQVANCQAEAIDLEPLVLRRTLKICAPEKLKRRVALVNLGGYQSSVNILRDGVLCHYRTIPVGGMALTQAIGNSLNLPYEEAEKLKKSKGEVLLDDTPAPPAVRSIFNAMQPVLSKLVTELKRSTDYYSATYKGEHVDLLYLCGGTAHLRRLDAYLKKELRISCEIADPFTNIVLPKNSTISRDMLKDLAPSAMSVLGLALR